MLNVSLNSETAPSGYRATYGSAEIINIATKSGMFSMHSYAGRPGSYVPERREMPDLHTRTHEQLMCGRGGAPSLPLGLIRQVGR